MNSQNWIQFAIVALFVGMSVFGWVIRQLNEIRAKREVQQQRLRVQQEALRTGRTAEPDAEETAAAAAAQAEAERRAALAEQRRQRLEELRRRQQAQRRTAGSTATASTGTATPAPPRLAPTPTPPAPTARRTARPIDVPVQPEQGPRNLPSRTQRAAQSPRANQSRARSENMSPRKQTARDLQLAADAASDAFDLANEAAVRRGEQAKDAPRRSRLAGPQVVARVVAPLAATTIAQDMRNRESLRRAIILNELLSPPVSMRPPTQSIGG